jgi:GrpB-like predicted nucleotidyltransferase (UPF0157 family)
METEEQRIQRVLGDTIAISPYDPAWPALFLLEKAHLTSCLLASAFSGDRIAYTRGKTAFVERVTEQAKRYYSHGVGSRVVRARPGLHGASHA